MKRPFLNLGKQPIANKFLQEGDFEDEYFYDLIVSFDEETKLVTHEEYVDPKMMFNDEYVYRGSMSNTMVNHFRELSNMFGGKLNKTSKVLEIGSNDGVFIKNWSTDQAIAVEPCGNFAQETNDMGYKTYPNFWNKELSNKILEEEGKRDLIFAANCICHIPDLDDAFSSIHNLLADHGQFIFEDPSLMEMINRNSFDQIYDEHPHVFSVIALKNLLERNGLTIVRVDNISVHGGSNRICAMKTEDVSDDDIHISVDKNLQLERILGLDKYETFVKWSDTIQRNKEELYGLLTKLKDNGLRVISYGASSKSTTIFNYCDIDNTMIDFILDNTPSKIGKFSPGKHIPVIDSTEGFPDDVDFCFLGAWNFIEEIKNKENEYVDRGGRFITHTPTIKLN
jgi:SAM-dependent methyltransferase